MKLANLANQKKKVDFEQDRESVENRTVFRKNYFCHVAWICSLIVIWIALAIACVRIFTLSSVKDPSSVFLFRIVASSVNFMFALYSSIPPSGEISCLYTYIFFTWKPYNQPYLFFETPIFTIMTFFPLILTRISDVLDYDPFENDELLLEKEFEETTQEKWLSVKQSSLFRIVIENVGTETCEKFDVSRGSWLYLLNVEHQLKPGESVVIIPETHNEPGAYKAKGHRSFGPNKNSHVETIVEVYDKRAFYQCSKVKYSTKLVQKFGYPYITKMTPNRFIEDRL